MEEMVEDLLPSKEGGETSDPRSRSDDSPNLSSADALALTFPAYEQEGREEPYRSPKASGHRAAEQHEGSHGDLDDSEDSDEDSNEDPDVYEIEMILDAAVGKVEKVSGIYSVLGCSIFRPYNCLHILTIPLFSLIMMSLPGPKPNGLFCPLERIQGGLRLLGY